MKRTLDACARHIGYAAMLYTFYYKQESNSFLSGIIVRHSEITGSTPGNVYVLAAKSTQKIDCKAFAELRVRKLLKPQRGRRERRAFPGTAAGSRSGMLLSVDQPTLAQKG
eukprot:6175820-Pleurochrysis_carterae.AAC.2